MKVRSLLDKAKDSINQSDLIFSLSADIIYSYSSRLFLAQWTHQYPPPLISRCSMVVVCKPSNSPKFYENLFVLQQHMQKLRMCCSSVVDTAAAAGGDSCLQCGASQQLWHSPLTLTNNAVSVVQCPVMGLLWVWYGVRININSIFR